MVKISSMAKKIKIWIFLDIIFTVMSLSSLMMLIASSSLSFTECSNQYGFYEKILQCKLPAIYVLVFYMSLLCSIISFATTIILFKSNSKSVIRVS